MRKEWLGRGLILAAGLALMPGRVVAADKAVTFWTNVEIETTDEKLVTIDKLHGKQKMGKACAGKAASFDHWTVLTADATGTRAAQVVEIVAAGIPNHGAKVSSIRAEGECKDGSTKWLKYSGVIDKAPMKAVVNPASASPARTATPLPKPPAPKKEDGKKNK